MSDGVAQQDAITTHGAHCILDHGPLDQRALRRRAPHPAPFDAISLELTFSLQDRVVGLSQSLGIQGNGIPAEDFAGLYGVLLDILAGLQRFH